MKSEEILHIPGDGFIRLKTILKIIPISRSSFVSGFKSGRYPAPVRLSERSIGWKASNIRALIDELSHQKIETDND